MAGRGVDQPQQRNFMAKTVKRTLKKAPQANPPKKPA